MKFVLGILAGALIALFGDFVLRAWRTRSYFKKFEKSHENRDYLDQELRELIAEENEKLATRYQEVHPAGETLKNVDIQYLDVDVLAAVYKKQLRRNKKSQNLRDNYWAQPPNSASWGSD